MPTTAARPFWYQISSLRIDGDWSADPADYRDRPPDRPLGQALHAFLVAHLQADLAPHGEKGQRRPGEKGQGMEWTVPHSIIVATRPTVRDLEFWAQQKRLFVTACGPQILADPNERPMLDLERLLKPFKVQKPKAKSLKPKARARSR